LIVQPTFNEFRAMCPNEKTYDIKEITVGNPVSNFSRKQGRLPLLMIDFGYRVDNTSGYVPETLNRKGFEVKHDVSWNVYYGTRSDGTKFVNETKPTREDEVAYKSYIGSKLIIMREDNPSIALISDAGKALDFIGGKWELGESPMQTLVREVKEEIGIDISGYNVKGHGFSDVIERGHRGHVFARTVMFSVTVSATDPIYNAPGIVWKSGDEMYQLMEAERDSMLFNAYQPWVKRILSSYVSSIFVSLVSTINDDRKKIKAYRSTMSCFALYSHTRMKTVLLKKLGTMQCTLADLEAVVPADPCFVIQLLPVEKSVSNGRTYYSLMKE